MLIQDATEKNYLNKNDLKFLKEHESEINDGNFDSVISYHFDTNNDRIFKVLYATFENELLNNITFIPDCAFDDIEDINSISIPNNITSIGEGAFAHCPNLETVRFSEGVEEFSRFIFAYSGIKYVYFHNTDLESVPRSMFIGCDNLQVVKCPKNLFEFFKENKNRMNLSEEILNNFDRIFQLC